MKIISLNLHCHKEENEQEKLNRVAKFILENDIDVCLLQELCQHKDNKEVVSGIKEDNNGYYLMKKTGYHFCFRDFKLGFGVYEEGLGILSKYPIENPELINLTHTMNYSDWFRRCALKASINGIDFIDIHMGWSLPEEPFMDQLHILEKHFTENTILGGDFNYPDFSPEIAYIKDRLASSHDDFHVDSKTNPTFHNELDSKIISNNRMIDFLFHGKNIKIKSFSIHMNKEKDYVSDHSLIAIEI